jgi:hypothetical protein
MSFLQQHTNTGGPELLLDNQSSCDIATPDMLTDIHQVDGWLYLDTNAGQLRTNLKGYLPLLGKEMWCSDEIIANIISWKSIRNDEENYHCGYEYEDRAFYITNKHTGNTLWFPEQKNGLHVATVDYSDLQHDVCLAQTDNKIPTVKDNQAWFTKKQIDGANRARAFQRIACYPPDADLIKALSLGKLKNVDFTIDDVKNAAKIYGPDLAAIKGRTTRKEGRGPINDYVEIPEEFIEAHKDIELTMDIVTVEGLKFFHSKDTNIKYHYVEYLPNTKQPAIRSSLDRVFGRYNQAGLYVDTIHADNEFEFLKDELETPEHQINVNICAAEEHEHVIE